MPFVILLLIAAVCALVAAWYAVLVIVAAALFVFFQVMDVLQRRREARELEEARKQARLRRDIALGRVKPHIRDDGSVEWR